MHSLPHYPSGSAIKRILITPLTLSRCWLQHPVRSLNFLLSPFGLSSHSQDWQPAETCLQQSQQTSLLHHFIFLITNCVLLPLLCPLTTHPHPRYLYSPEPSLSSPHWSLLLCPLTSRPARSSPLVWLTAYCSSDFGLQYSLRTAECIWREKRLLEYLLVFPLCFLFFSIVLKLLSTIRSARLLQIREMSLRPFPAPAPTSSSTLQNFFLHRAALCTYRPHTPFPLPSACLASLPPNQIPLSFFHQQNAQPQADPPLDPVRSVFLQSLSWSPIGQRATHSDNRNTTRLWPGPSHLLSRLHSAYKMTLDAVNHSRGISYYPYADDTQLFL